MPTLSSKHPNARREFYPSFDGGVNLAVPAESMAKNELKEAMNVEFSPLTGSMKVRGGLVWSGRFGSKTGDVVPVYGRRGFLVNEQNTPSLRYFKWNNVWPVAQSGVSWLTDWDEKMSIASWEEKVDDGDDAEERDCWLLSAGGSLQKFTESPIPTLKTITSAPENCRLVFVRNGRVGVVDGTDRITFSAVGDCENWTTDDNDTSSAQWIDIGYKDGMDITAVIPLSKDLIIFKNPPGEPDKGIIWRLTGDYPDWQAVEVAHNTGTFSQQSVCAVGNDIFYATVAGIATLSTVTNYGEVKTAWPDRKVNNALTPLLTDTAKLFDVPVKQQLWIMPSADSKEVWVFDYAHGIWTTFKFPEPVIYAAGVDNSLYVFMGRNLYELSDGYTQDEVEYGSTGTLWKSTIEARMKLGTVLSGMQTLIKGVFASFELMPQCDAELWLGKFKMPFSYGGDVELIYDPPNDTQYACEDDDPLVPTGGVLTSRRRCIVREWAITPEIKIRGGGCAVPTLGLEVAEV